MGATYVNIITVRFNCVEYHTAVNMITVRFSLLGAWQMEKQQPVVGKHTHFTC